MKPFVICAADGTIVNIYGFYSATDNDASIMANIFKDEQNEDLRSLILPGDIMLLDRGFRDCLSYLKNTFQINTRTPTCNELNLIHIT